MTRDDGSKQWSFKSKPLYSYIDDKGPGYIGGNKVKVGRGRAGGKGPQEEKTMPKGWVPATFKPSAGMKFPAGMAMREARNMFGQVLVDEQGMLKKDLAEDGLHPNAAGYKIMVPLADSAIQKAMK